MSQENPKNNPPSDEEKPTPASRDAQAGSGQARPASIHQDSTKPMAPYSASEAGGPVADIDEGPRSGPVDEIQQALFEAAQADLPTEVEFDELAIPLPGLDSGPRSRPVDDVQEAILEAVQAGRATDVDFETLPPPMLSTEPQKVVKFQSKPIPPQPVEPPHPEPEIAAVLPDAEVRPTTPDFWFILAIFVTFRFLTLLLLRPGGFIRDWSDFDTYFGIAGLSDYALYPFLDFWLEWPPLLPWLAVGAYKLALFLPPWPDDPRLWFILILGLVFILFEVGNFFLIYRLACRLFQDPAIIYRLLWFYAGLFPPIYAMLGFFDGMTLFFMLLSLELILADRRFVSAMASGVGFMIKIIPILMLPVALRRLWYQYRANVRDARIEAGLYTVIFGLTVVVLLAPFIIIPALNGAPQWWMTTARSIVGRSSWETIWAIAEGYYGFGAVGGDRFNPNVSLAEFAIHTGWPGGEIIWPLIALAFAGVYLYLFTRPADYSRPRNLVAFTGLTIAVFMLYSKGYSPQFLVYLLPFVLLLMPNGRGLTYALTLTGLNILEQPIYFVLLPTESWLLAFVVIARFVLFLLLTVEFGLVLWPAEDRLTTLGWVQQRIPLVLGGLAGLACLLLTPLSLWAYTNDQLTSTPVGDFAGFIEAQTEGQPQKPRLLLNDQLIYRQLYPALGNTLDMQLADGGGRFEGAASVGDLVRGLEQVWVLPTGPQQNALSNAVAGRGELLGTYNFEGLGAVSLYTFQPNPVPLIAPARCTGGIELLTHQVEVGGGAINLTLYWRALETQTQNLKVFTQLLNSAGEQVAGHDSVPRNHTAPVTGWAVEVIQADPHRLDLPAGLPPDEYTLIVGLYNDFTERVRCIDPAGFGFPNHAISLEKLMLP
jgi:hypothetical protein